MHPQGWERRSRALCAVALRSFSSAADCESESHRTLASICGALCDTQGSFGKAKSWVDELQQHAAEDIIIALAGRAYSVLKWAGNRA